MRHWGRWWGCASQYKFVVDGVWRYDPWAPVVRDEGGNFNNVIEIIDPRTSFDVPSDFDPPPSPPSWWTPPPPPPQTRRKPIVRGVGYDTDFYLL